ncbi:MAG: winged helix-turn-helix transcriptional regulator [Chloroflexi bacterium]|nr:winged helix-turn-helix transcriptional regulator [Chloroflexota bacterium]
MNLNSIWTVLDESFDPLNENAYSVWQKIATEQGFEPGWITWLSALFVFGSDPFSTAGFMRLFPYGSARVLEARFGGAIKHGILIASGENEYHATEKGMDWRNQMTQAASNSIAHLQPIPPPDLQKIVNYGRRITEASLAAPEPPSKFGASHYFKNMYPGEGERLLRFFIHYFGTLDKYRGNAHLATWKHYNIEGNRWEVFSEIWGGKNNTLDKLFEELSFRGITRPEYAEFLQELAERGWIEETSGEYQLTAEGKRIREEAEALTDKYFFAPWSCLNESELEDLFNLSTQLRDGLKSSNKKE